MTNDTDSRIPKWLQSPMSEIISSVLGTLITFVVKQAFEQTTLALFLIIVLIMSTVVWLVIVFFTTKRFPAMLKSIAILAISGIVVTLIVLFLLEYIPPFQVIKQWDFEDGTTQNWGVLAHDRVEGSYDIVASADVSQGNYSLKVTNIDESSDEGNARKKLVAIHFNPTELSHTRRIKADLYLPTEVAALVGYADVKLFLKDGNLNWHDSANGGEGTRMDHFSGQWVTVVWDLRLARLFWVSPWKDYVGVQLFVKDNFEGPIYVDNVTLYK